MWLFSIRTKLFILVFTGFCALVAVIYWQIGNKASEVSLSTIDRSLQQSSNILETRIESRFTFIQEIALGIARDGRVLPFVSEQASLTLQDLSLEYLAIYEVDVLFFMNAQGDILARADDEDAIGINLAGRSSLFDDALEGQLSRGFIVSRGKLMQTIAAPVFDNVAKDLVKGVVVLAYELSEDTATEIVSLTQSQVGFFTFTRDDDGIIDGIAPSYMSNAAVSETKMNYFSQSASQWQQILEADSNNFRQTFSVDGAQQHSVFRRINSKDGTPLGFVVAMRATEELVRPFKEIQQGLLVTGGIGVLLASLLALAMAIGISRPIIRLVQLTKQIQMGLYPDQSQKSQAKDEVALLQNALVDMGKGLKEKAEYEAYLAELSSEIENDSTLTLKNADATVIAPRIGGAQSGARQQTVAQRYRLLSSLGTGTMGQVYLAEDMDLQEKVALKVMQKDFFNSIDGINVKEEIRLARQITHRNIVRTYDFGITGDEIFITMEYVHGYDLVALLDKKGPLDEHIGLAIIRQICSAMIAAHEMGIIHRDLKPGNMIVNRQGILKIMDFGLAMRVEPSKSGDSDASEEQENHRMIMGTPRYMAPEQFSTSSRLDERTDIYAIGVLMFTLFNGEPPFSNSDFQKLELMHRNDPIPPLSARLAAKQPPLPDKVIDIIQKAMAKEPSERFQSVREILAAIEAFSAAVK